MTEMLGVRISDGTADMIDEIAAQSRGATRSDIARIALERGLNTDMRVDIYDDLQLTDDMITVLEHESRGRTLEERRDTATDIDLIIRFLRSDGPATKSEILSETGLSDMRWTGVLVDLIQKLASETISVYRPSSRTYDVKDETQG